MIEMSNKPEKTKMYFEWNWPTFWSNRENFTIFDLHIDFQHHGDHSPGFHFGLVIFNLNLLDFGYYNVHHAPDAEEYRVWTEKELPEGKKPYWMVWDYSSPPEHGVHVYPSFTFITAVDAENFTRRVGENKKIVRVILND